MLSFASITRATAPRHPIRVRLHKSRSTGRAPWRGVAVDPVDVCARPRRARRFARRRNRRLHRLQRHQRPRAAAHEPRRRARAQLRPDGARAHRLCDVARLAAADRACDGPRRRRGRYRCCAEYLRGNPSWPARAQLAARLLWHRRGARTADHDRGAESRFAMAARLRDCRRGPVTPGCRVRCDAPTVAADSAIENRGVPRGGR